MIMMNEKMWANNKSVRGGWKAMNLSKGSENSMLPVSNQQPLQKNHNTEKKLKAKFTSPIHKNKGIYIFLKIRNRPPPPLLKPYP